MNAALTPVTEIRRLPSSFLDSPSPGAEQRPPVPLSVGLSPTIFRPLGRIIPIIGTLLKIVDANPNRKSLHLNVRGGTGGISFVALYGAADVDRFYSGGDFSPLYGIDTNQEYIFECAGAFYCALVNGPDVSIWAAETLYPVSQ